MDRHEERAPPLTLTDHHLEHAFSVRGDDVAVASVGQARLDHIRGMNFDEWLCQMRTKPRAQARSRHAVPLVADTTGVEGEGEVVGAGAA